MTAVPNATAHVDGDTNCSKIEDFDDIGGTIPGRPDPVLDPNDDHNDDHNDDDDDNPPPLQHANDDDNDDDYRLATFVEQSLVAPAR